MRLTITNDCEFNGRTYTAGQTVLISGQGAVDLLNSGNASCESSRTARDHEGNAGSTSAVSPASERATKKRKRIKKVEGDG